MGDDILAKQLSAGLIGVSGYGASHLANLSRLAKQQRVRLVSAADIVEPDERARATLEKLGASWFDGGEALLESTRPDIVVIAAPPYLHRPLVVKALEGGSHVLVEKPPAVTEADFEAMEAASRRAGRLVQVGFQTVGSGALDRLLELAGSLKVQTVQAAGAWVRQARYYQRSPWAGRARFSDAPTGDGALCNPFAHAVMNALVVACEAGSPGGVSAPRTIEVDRFAANDIEVDDTASLRVSLDNGRRVVVAVTLCASKRFSPFVDIRGEHGWARWAYESDRVEVGDHSDVTRVEQYPRINLLEDLLEVTAGKRPYLRCPLSRTRAFVAAAEKIIATPVARVSAGAIRHGEGLDSWWEIPGIEDAIQRSAASGRLLSELDLSWAA